METNDAPEKIYAYIPEDDIVGTASTQKGIPHQFVNTEYTRTDIFIKKACEWLSSHFYDDEYQFRDNDGTWIDADCMIEDFKKYMEE